MFSSGEMNVLVIRVFSRTETVSDVHVYPFTPDLSTVTIKLPHQQEYDAN